MQFTIIASILAAAGMAAAQTNGTIVNPTGTGVAAPTGTGSVNGTSNGGPGIQSFDNGANSVAGSALGLVVAGGVALFL